MHRLSALALALPMLAGCLSLGADDPRAEAAFAEGERVSYFHSAMTLAARPEENASAVRTGAFFQRWAAGDDYPTFVADPLGSDALVTAATVTLFLEATGPVVESGRFPDIMVYGGSGDAWMGFGDRRDVTALRPGQVVELEVELEFPAGGLWVPAAEGFGLKVVPVMMQQDENADIRILLGGERASQVRWTVQALRLPSSTPVVGSGQGEVVGTIYAGPAAPRTTSARVALDVPEGSAYVVAWMNTSESVGIPDLDLAIVGPDGETIATSGTPTPREAVRIAGPNLRGGGEYSLVVTTAGAPRASFRVEWVVGAPPLGT